MQRESEAEKSITKYFTVISSNEHSKINFAKDIHDHLSIYK